MTVVALTGGAAAGKSTVTTVLEECGAIVIDADRLAREAVAPGSEVAKAIASRFGPEIIDSSGNVDRGALGAIVFADEQARKDLNQLVHPRVRELYEEARDSLRRTNPQAIIVYAVPLLVEARSVEEFDAVVVVHAPVDLRVRRLVEFRGFSEADARARVQAQASDAERLACADVILDASGSVADTLRAAHELYGELSELWPDRLEELSRRFPRVNS
jgi:dephospho-CoA kinase